MSQSESGPGAPASASVGAPKPGGAKPTTGAVKPAPAKVPRPTTGSHSKPNEEANVSNEPASKRQPTELPPRPPSVDADGRDLSSAVSQARKRLGEMAGEGNRKIVELKHASEGLEEAVERLEKEVERTQTLLERNEELARQAERLLGEGTNLDQLQDELEEQIRESEERINAAEVRLADLKQENTRLKGEVEELDEKIADEQEQVTSNKKEAEQLEKTAEKLQEENRELEQNVTRLKEKVSRLEQMKAMFMDELKDTQGVLTEAMTIQHTPAPAPESKPEPNKPQGSSPGQAPKPGN